MPQPVKEIGPVYSEPGIMLQRPTLAALIAAISSHWTQIEDVAALAFAWLLSKDDEAALLIHTEMIDMNLKNKAFKAVAKVKLSEKLIKETDKVFKTMRCRARDRHKVVHGNWAVADDKPNSLILLDKHDFMKFQFQVVQGILSSEKELDLLDYVAMQEYKEKDFRPR